jgi:hypothetical protein
MGAGSTPLSPGRILDAAFDLLRQHAALLVGLAALEYVPLALAADSLARADPGAAPDRATGVAVGVVVLALLASPIVVGAITQAVAVLRRGESTDAGGALRGGLASALPLLATFLLAGGVAALSVAPLALLVAAWESLPAWLRPLAAIAFALLPFAVLLRFVLLQQVVVLEQLVGARAMRRASALVRGHLARSLAVLGAAGLLMALLAVAAGAAFGSLPWIGPIAAGVVQSVGFAYTTAVGVVLYDDLRLRKGELRSAEDLRPPAP